MRATRATLAGALWALLVAGPVHGATPLPSPLPQSPVEGFVVDIEADDPFEVGSFTLRTRDGPPVDLVFAIGQLAPTSFPPFHLFEHHATGEPILVLFEAAPDGTLVAVDLREAAGAWLDRLVPDDATPGSRITVGATLWDKGYERPPIAIGNVFFRLSPATGEAEPAEARATSDWEGHYTADLEVPAGGSGELAVGVEIVLCAEGGACDRYDGLFGVAGMGPPPGIPLTRIATASIVAPPSVAAGEPFDVEIELSLKADWDPETFHLFNALVVDVREARGPSIDTVEAVLEDPAGGYYVASITLPEAGRYVLQVGTAADALFATGVAPIEATAPPEPEAAPTSAPDLVPIVVGAAVVALLLVVGAVALRRAG